MKYKITIPKPCHENWNDMTSTQRGAFCNACKKEVIDFTNTSSTSIYNSIKHKKHSCGKFKPEQLNTTLQSTSNLKIKTPLVFTFSIIVFTALPVVAQQKVKTVIVDNKTTYHQHIHQQKETDTLIIKGNISDQEIPLPNAIIIYKNHQDLQTQSDLDGNFELEIPRAYLEKKSKLIVSFVGYMPKEVDVKESKTVYQINMTNNEAILGEVVVVRKLTFFRWVGNLFRKK
ncbi:carboxypeptidase-like regulatory domain-containing protein [Zhouia sp. PK063]|uniref:carboxypeptidase-like regulatory domain-containing protein n=1 Tax=Zhouia sp. PK063 TaxID=3373602 RepID=UPI0037B46865